MILYNLVTSSEVELVQNDYSGVHRPYDIGRSERSEGKRQDDQLSLNASEMIKGRFLVLVILFIFVEML